MLRRACRITFDGASQTSRVLPSEVLVLERDSIPKTSSGKLRRSAVAELLAAE
jgi:acyl-CoA synthetase (AMP-forming)/AMP-acid ligase II